MALPATLVFRTIYALGTAVSRPKTVMIINLGSVASKFLFNWIFMFGKLGIPAMGAAGAGLSTALDGWLRSEEHTSELQSLMRISYAVLCLNKDTTPAR